MGVGPSQAGLVLARLVPPLIHSDLPKLAYLSIFDYKVPNYLYIHWNCVISLFLVEFCGEVWNKEFMLTDVCILEVLASINTFLGKLPTKLIFIDFVLQNEKHIFDVNILGGAKMKTVIYIWLFFDEGFFNEKISLIDF